MKSSGSAEFDASCEIPEAQKLMGFKAKGSFFKKNIPRPRRSSWMSFYNRRRGVKRSGVKFLE